jgi:putative endonuclease
MTRPGYVYLMANRRRGKTYLGVTSNLAQRAYQHRRKLIDGYSKDHDCTLLVWFEAHDDIHDARAREWKLKKWRREVSESWGPRIMRLDGSIYYRLSSSTA